MDYTLLTDEEIAVLDEIVTFLENGNENDDLEEFFKELYEKYGEEKFKIFQSNLKGFGMGTPWFEKKEKWSLKYLKFCRIDTDQIKFVKRQRELAIKDKKKQEKISVVSGVIITILYELVKFVVLNVII